mgnify:CR=1 FL=1
MKNRKLKIAEFIDSIEDGQDSTLLSLATGGSMDASTNSKTCLNSTLTCKGATNSVGCKNALTMCDDSTNSESCENFNPCYNPCYNPEQICGGSTNVKVDC